jgi:ELWxxDGT repeat protein
MPFPWDRSRRLRSFAVARKPSRRAPVGDRARLGARRLAVEPLEDRALLTVIPTLVADVYSGSGSSNPDEFVGTSAGTFFTANDGTSGTELWLTDSTAAGTALVKDIRTGSASSNPQSLVNMGDVLYFVATDGVNGAELWRSDGTAAGTTMVLDIRSGSASSSPTSLTVVGDTLYFLADDGTHGRELWATDGTAANTRLVKDICVGATGSGAGDLTAYHGKLFFNADDGVHGAELWSSDGTAAGTALLVDINSGSSPSYPFYFTEVNGTLYFSADDGTNGAELWQTDGTAAGTSMVADIYGGTGFSSSPYKLTAVGDTLYFLADNGLYGFELWKSDGTEAGTVFVKDINEVVSDPTPGAPTDSCDADYLTNVGGVLYFQANDGIHGAELWKSDGTESGTTLVEDINPGASGSQPTRLVALSGALYFTATNGTNGFELWRSRGTEDTTKMVADIRAGSSSSTPLELAVANGSLYFSADDGIHGRELWTIGPNSPPTDIALAPTVAPESRVGAYVGTFTTTDPDTGDEFTYALVSGTGDTDNDKFYIDGDELKTNVVMTWDDAPLSILVETRDISDNIFVKQFYVDLGGIFVAPSSVNENAPIGTVVGNLSGKIGANTETFTFTLYAGADAGTTDNDSFTISGGQLKTNAVFDYEADNSYTVAILATGAAGTFWTYETITINDVNDPPTVVDDLYSMLVDQVYTVTAPSQGVLANDLDQEGDTLHAVLVTDVEHGTLTLNDDGTFTYVPDPDSRQYDSFTYRAYDGSTYSNDVATVTLNWRPVAFADSYALDEGSSLAVLDTDAGVLANDHDYDWEYENPGGTPPLTVSLYSSPAHGTLTLYPDGTFLYTPETEYYGTDTFTYVAIDDYSGHSLPATVTLTVNNIPDAPVANDDSFTTLGDQVLIVAAPGVLANDTDADVAVDPTKDSLTVRVATPPASGTLALGSNGGFTYTPVVGYTGTVTFTYTVTDTFGLSDSATVTIVCEPMTANVVVSIRSTLWEGAGTVAGGGRVTIPRGSDPRLQGDIVVTLTSSDASELLLPATVTVPAGQNYVDFAVTAVNDGLWDGNQTVQVTARARGLMPGTTSTLIHDNEADTYVLENVDPTTQYVDEYFTITVTPKNLDGEVIPIYAETVPIYATSDNGILAVTVTGSVNGLPFENGALTTQVAVRSTGTNVRLVVDDGREDVSGGPHTGRSNIFQVITNSEHPIELVFGAIAADQAVGLGFQVTVTAVDTVTGLVATDYSGALYLSGWSNGGTASQIVITEASDQDTDFLEIQNVSGQAVNVQGWKLVVNDAAAGSINAVHASKTLSGTMEADQVSFWTDDPTWHYFGTDIRWGSTTGKGWVLLLDSSGTVRDFVAWGYTGAQIAAMAPVVDGATVHIGSAWSGDGATYGGKNAISLQRWGTRDGNTSADFLWQTTTQGAQNSLVQTPFIAAKAVSIVPSGTGDFVDGRWTGTVTIHVEADGMFLWASDSAGLTATSDPFNVNAVNNLSGIGAYDPETSTFYLRCENNSGNADYIFGYGAPGAGWLPIAGDWDGDGVDTVGLYDPATSLFYLSNSNVSGYADLVIGFGPGGGHTRPVAGDWNGDGIDTIGIYDELSSTFYLRNENTTGVADLCFGYGAPGAGWLPTAGDWDSDGFDGVALYDPATSFYYVKARLGSGYADLCFGYGEPGAGWQPFAGSWSESGTDTVGVYDPSSALYYERYSNTVGTANLVFGYGLPNWLPLAGDWNGPALLSAATVGTADAATIDTATVGSLLDAALTRWSDAGLSAPVIERLRTVNLVVADLSGAALGKVVGNTLYIDANAAGHGWFVDLTPDDDLEFVADATTGQLLAVDAAAVDGIDLLTVLSHELGHLAGLDDLSTADSLMGGLLSTGQRREPGAAEVDALLATFNDDGWL